jgi:hypothetical protein
MTPLMQQGYRRPITDKDIWKLDSWDEAETLYTRYVLSLSLRNSWTCKLKDENLSQIPEVLECRASKTKTLAVASSS